MKRLGQVKALINDQLVLIDSSEPLKENEIITVFSVIKDDRLADAAGIDTLAFPKGELRVVCPQENNIYLVERFRELKKETTRVTSPNRFQQGLLGFISEIQGETQEVIREVAGPWSAQIDAAKSLGIKIDISIQVGDLVGRL